MKNKYKLIFIGALGLLPLVSNAQMTLPTDSIKNVQFKEKFTNVKNYNFFILGNDSINNIYNINGNSALPFPSEEWVLAPMTTSKLLYVDGKHVRQRDLTHISYSDMNYDRSFFKLGKEFKNIRIDKLAYSPDGRFFLVTTTNGKLMKCTTQKVDKDKRIAFTLDMEVSPSEIIINKKANGALAVIGRTLKFINLERGNIRNTLSFDGKIIDITYSKDNKECAVLLDNGSIHTINTATAKEIKQYNSLGKASHCCYMQQGKYLMVAEPNKLKMLNLLTGKVDYVLNTTGDNIIGMDATLDSDKDEWMLYFTNNNFKGLPLSLIERYHTMDLKRELDLRMAEWSKIRPGESEIDYRARVNDETRAKYALELERSLVTEMAGDIIGNKNGKFGSYVESSQALSVNFEGMPTIYLNIPAEDLVELSTIEDLEFFNTVYGLTDEDKFEVIYTEARNKKTGKVYIYDNLDRKSIAFDEDSFVPMEVIQLASIESSKLEELKQEEMQKAINENILSDHTKITVSTEVEQDIDADGNKILNYNINYQYDVEEDFSARDDFKPGKYNTAESNAATQMVNIIKKSLEGDFAKYTKDSKKLIVSITGSADALPITGKVRYNDEYGDIEDLLVYQDGELSTMTVTKASGMTSNEQLAMVRAYSMSDYLKNNVFSDIHIPMENKYNIEVSNEEGGKFRRIKVSLKFVDTFK